jgi:hypothetical protein
MSDGIGGLGGREEGRGSGKGSKGEVRKGELYCYPVSDVLYCLSVAEKEVTVIKSK